MTPEIERDQQVKAIAKKVKMPRYMWDTLDGLSALARFMDEARASSARPEEAAIRNAEAQEILDTCRVSPSAWEIDGEKIAARIQVREKKS